VGGTEAAASVRVAEPQVALIAYTCFRDPGWFPEWKTDAAHDAAALVEFAGRLCYMSFHNPLGRTNRGYVDHLLAQRHFSVIEHASATVAIRGVSRSLTHELVRHRHFSFSQLSQRFVSEDDAAFVVPEELRRLGLEEEALRAAGVALDTYRRLAAAVSKALQDRVPDKIARRKLARQAARAVLPNMTETAIVVTGNLRAWATFLKKRGAAEAEPEIRRLALMIHPLLMEVAPEVFGHFEVRELAGGQRVLHTEIDFE
jgi:thymidylate synthase (FAD)